MADAFAPKLSSSEVRFNQPVENQSTSTLIGGAGDFLRSFVSGRPEPGPKGPLGSAGNPDVVLGSYTKDLQALVDLRDTIGDTSYQVKLRQLNVKYADMGYPVTGDAFKKVRFDLTGVPEEVSSISPTQKIYNDLSVTVEGQAQLAIADAQFRTENEGRSPTQDELVNFVVAEQANKQALEGIKIKTELEYSAALPTLQLAVSNLAKQFNASLTVLEENGLRVDDPAMLQESYLRYQAERTRVVNKIPLGIPDRDQKIKDLFQVTDQFFSQLGIDQDNFQIRSKDQLDLKRKAMFAVEALNARGDQASAALAMGIFNNNFQMTDDQFRLLSGILSEEDMINTTTPGWITDAGIVVSNDMITVAQQLTTVGAQTLRTAAGAEEALTNLVGQESADLWASLSSEKAWKDLTTNSGVFKGFDRNAILTGEVPSDIPYQFAFKLSMALKTIDFENEAVSFGGLRSAVDSNLPGVLDALEARDPQKGQAARSLVWLSTGKAARQYEAQITSEEQRLGMVFNPTTRKYSVDFASIIPDSVFRQEAQKAINEQYGGDIIRAVDDKFAKLKGVNITVEGGGGRANVLLTSILTDTLPPVDEMKRVLDLRNSAVYLDSLSRKIEPEDARIAREVLGQDVMEVTAAETLGAGAIEAISNAPLPGEITTQTLGAGNDSLGGGAGSDTLRGAGSGSSSTSAQITYALPEVIAADTEFLDKVVSVSSDLGFDPNDLLRVIDFETAGSFSPKAQPIRKDGTKISSATGLIQFLEKTAKGLGTTTADLANMTAVEQLDYVKKYFEPFKDRIKNFGDVYMAVHWPKGVGKDDSYVMYEAGSDSYNANKGLDTNGDGTVTRGETLARLFSATGKGGNPTAGTPANENTVAAAAGPAVQRAVNNAPSASSPMAATTPAATAEVAPMEATAALPEAIPTEVAATGTQGASELSPAIALDQDVQAFIQEIAGDPDKTYASEAEFVAAQEAGELEPGDTVVVNGEIYVVRKNGLIRRLGTVNS
jgi:hypothetical protein